MARCTVLTLTPRSAPSSSWPGNARYESLSAYDMIVVYSAFAVGESALPARATHLGVMANFVRLRTPRVLVGLSITSPSRDSLPRLVLSAPGGAFSCLYATAWAGRRVAPYLGLLR